MAVKQKFSERVDMVSKEIAEGKESFGIVIRDSLLVSGLFDLQHYSLNYVFK